MKTLIQRIGAGILTVYFLYQSYQGFFNKQITIAGRIKSLTIIGPACVIASIGALLLSAGSAWRIITDSNDEFLKPFTLKSVLFWIGLLIIVFAIFFHASIG